MDSLPQIRSRGLIVAFSGFGITRLFVAETLQIDAPIPFLIVGLLPLVVGLALTVYGVALALGPFESEYVNTVARWHLLGVGSMAIVFAVTGVDRFFRNGGAGFEYEVPLLVANVLLGGAIGGTLTGIRTGRLDRQRRTIRHSANRALLINRLLRHEVLNAVTIIGGHADLLNGDGGPHRSSMIAIRRAVRRIKSTVEEVGTLTKSGDWSKRLDVATIAREEIDRIEREYDLDVSFIVRIEDPEIAADERLSTAVHELLENAVVHGGGSGVTVELDGSPRSVELSVTDDGPGMPNSQRVLLTTPHPPEADDPTAGFGHQIVRLIVLQLGGEIRVHDSNTGEGGATVTLVLPRSEHRTLTAETVRLSFPNLTHALFGGVLGGVAMGFFYQVSTGLLPVIGSLYGVESPLVGWITHLFHSAVFGLLFAAIAAKGPIHRFVSSPFRSSLVGMGWGAVLWLVAAGVLMPGWLTLLGVPTPIPSLSTVGFVGHALWGGVLGGTYWSLGRLGADDRR